VAHDRMVKGIRPHNAIWEISTPQKFFTRYAWDFLPLFFKGKAFPQTKQKDNLPTLLSIWVRHLIGASFCYRPCKQLLKGPRVRRSLHRSIHTRSNHHERITMSTIAAHAAQPSLCSHLIENENGLAQPFCLIVTSRTANYACPECAVSLILRRLAAPGQTPASAAQGIVLNRCDHEGIDGQRGCWPCTQALQAELTKQWSREFFSDKAKANTLLRVRHHLSRYYDPADLRPHPKGREVAIRQPITETKEQRRERLARERIEKRNAAIRQERRLPEHGILQAQGRQTERITVVSPTA
jgi:hypothetical protein